MNLYVDKANSSYDPEFVQNILEKMSKIIVFRDCIVTKELKPYKNYN